MRGRRGERKRASAFTGPGRVALRLFHPQREVVLHGPLPLRARGGARARCPSSLTTVRVRARLECVWGTWAVARFQFRHYRAGADSRTEAVFEALPAPLRVVLLSLARRMRAALPPCLHVYGLSCRLAGYGDNPCWPPDLGPDSGLAPLLAPRFCPARTSPLPPNVPPSFHEYANGAVVWAAWAVVRDQTLGGAWNGGGESCKPAASYRPGAASRTKGVFDLAMLPQHPKPSQTSHHATHSVARPCKRRTLGWGVARPNVFHGRCSVLRTKGVFDLAMLPQHPKPSRTSHHATHSVARPCKRRTLGWGVARPNVFHGRCSVLREMTCSKQWFQCQTR